MSTRTPEEYRRWLKEQTENCLRQSNQTIDPAMAAAIDSAADNYMTVLERLTASRKKVGNIPQEE
ncbi:hypothetical protein [Bradyrhizobium sp. SYSU BS000235]|uniref:hypothetical protein n=1 Tax=Bradyrhizobium sp. SYSU BS000235 TaxID=3411332 RepID=UPI003C78B6E7